jgi:DNA end-binding protein Ku
VTCPIALFPATSESEKISFNQINKKTGNRIRYLKVDADSGEEVSNEDIIKGYQIDKDRYHRSLDKVALGRVVLTNREHVIALEARDKGLMGMLLRYPYEVRDQTEYFEDIEDVKITKDMLDLAKHIVEQKSGHFEPEKFEDHYRAAGTALEEAEGLADCGSEEGHPKQRRQSDGGLARQHWRESASKGSYDGETSEEDGEAQGEGGNWWLGGG